MKMHCRIAALLLVLSVFAASVSLVGSGIAEESTTAMPGRGASMADIAALLEDEAAAEAFLASLDNDALGLLQLLCERELHRRDVPLNDGQSDQSTYVVNINTDKFHRIDCKHVEDIKMKNRWDYEGSREDLIKFKYTPCKTCDP